MTIHTFSFEQALAEVRAASQDLQPHQSLVLTETAEKYFANSLPQELFNILRDLIDSQDITLKHKEDYYASFDVRVFATLVQLSFSPKTELIKMLEDGANLGSATDTHLKGENCKIAKDGVTRYKIIPIRTKDTGVKDLPLSVKYFSASKYETEESFLKKMVATIYEERHQIPMEIMYESRDTKSVYYRSAQIGKSRQRVYVATDRGKSTKSIERFTQFRVVSDRPGARKWTAPVIPGRHLADEAAILYSQHINSVIAKLSRIVDTAKDAQA